MSICLNTCGKTSPLPDSSVFRRSFFFLKSNIFTSNPSVSTSSAQADILSFTYPISESQPANPISNNVPSTSNGFPNSIALSLSNQTLSPSTCYMFSALTSPSVPEPTTSTSNSLPSIIASLLCILFFKTS
ncbi:hypothetical protein TNIN_384221 [Trichonephila inaurata madagascariensis]|uniref:Uncharacterized protein n=1 Tax=Trichonephila inaurata madagascariensis TaxID=2747483 RepID=A0A8X7C8Y7_9ARAC|nr:hypothetical protein TNIN_384221 [Trichonephila inaurata madagascariensis]